MPDKASSCKKSLDNGRPLSVECLAKAKLLPADFLHKLGLHDLEAGGVGIPYYDASGATEIAVKTRTHVVAKQGSYWPKGVPVAAYGQWRLDQAQRTGYLLLVEGESDCWASWHHDIPALGIPGADNAKTLRREHIEAIPRIYVCREPDQGGERFVPGVLKQLAALSWRGEVYELRMPDGCKDVADLHAKSGRSFADKFKEAQAQAPRLELPLPPGGVGSRLGRRAHFRPALAYRPFPVEALPNPVREYVAQSAQALGCDPAYVALPALAACASAIGNSRTIQLKRGWQEPSVIWTAIVGDSGTLKSPAYQKAVGSLFAVQRQRIAEHRKELRVWKAAKPQADEHVVGDEPTLKRVICSDTTIEKLAEMLEDNPRGLLVARDELAGWIGSFSRYKGKAGGTDLPNWLEMHRAGTIAVDRKTGDRRTIFVPRAAVSVTGGIQPGVLARALSPEFLDAGLAARLLLSRPIPKRKRWSEVEVDPEAEESYHQLLGALLDLELGDVDGEKIPHALTLSPEAKAVWVRFYDEWAQEQAAVEGELAAAYSKLEGYAARLALLHHVITHLDLSTSDLRPVGSRSIEAGIALVRWFAGEARRLYATLSESAEERDTRRLVEFAQARGGEMTARELQRSNGRRYPTAAHAEMALDALVNAEVGDWVPVTPSAKGGHPTQRFRLRPTHDTTDTTPPQETTQGDEAHDTTADANADTTLQPPDIPREL